MGFKNCSRDVAAICMGFQVAPHKTHANTVALQRNRLKTHTYVIKNKRRGARNHPNPKKTQMYSSSYHSKAAAQEQELFPPTAPAAEEASLHARAQLRLARTHDRIEIEIEIDFPVSGGRTSRTSSP